MSRIARSTSRPPTSGIRRSTITRSARRVCSCAIASRPLEQVTTSYPARCAKRLTTSRMPCSSSIDDQQAASARHTHSFETARSAARSAAIRTAASGWRAPPPRTSDRSSRQCSSSARSRVARASARARCARPRDPPRSRRDRRTRRRCGPLRSRARRFAALGGDARCAPSRPARPRRSRARS